MSYGHIEQVCKHDPARKYKKFLKKAKHRIERRRRNIILIVFQIIKNIADIVHKDETMMHYYNLPWAGRLGRVADSCIYCGESGMMYGASSGNRCLSCPNKTKEPIPELVEKYRIKGEKLARKWCDERGIDYEATIKKHADRFSENKDASHSDLIVWKDATKQMTDKEFLAKKEKILKLLRDLMNTDWWLDRKEWEWWEWQNVERKATDILEG